MPDTDSAPFAAFRDDMFTGLEDLERTARFDSQNFVFDAGGGAVDVSVAALMAGLLGGEIELFSISAMTGEADSAPAPIEKNSSDKTNRTEAPDPDDIIVVGTRQQSIFDEEFDLMQLRRGPVIVDGIAQSVIDWIVGTVLDESVETPSEREAREREREARLEEMERRVAETFDPRGAIRTTVTMRDGSRMSGWIKNGIFYGDGNNNGRPDVRYTRDGSGGTLADYGNGWGSTGNGPTW